MLPGVTSPEDKTSPPVVSMAKESLKTAGGGMRVDMVLLHQEARSSAPGVEGYEAGVGSQVEEPLIDPLASIPPLGPFLTRALEEIRKSENATSMEQNGVSSPRLASKMGILVTPKRRSSRRASTTDEDSTERAARLVAKRNLEEQDGMSFKNSFLSFNDKHLADNVKNVGISMGAEPSVINSSVQLIKDVEKNRFKYPTVQTCQDSHPDVDLENEETEVDLAALTNICGEFVDEVVHDDNDDYSNHVDTIFHNKKKPTVTKDKHPRRKPSTKKQIVFQ